MLDRLVTDVVTAALSVYGTIETPYFDSSSSGTDHHQVAASTAGPHQARIRHRGAGRARARMWMSGGSRTARVAGALTARQRGTAGADRAAARPSLPARGLPVAAPPFGAPPFAALTSGSSIHGSIAAGRNSEDSSPSRVSPAGDRA